jgi:hypothetical protein
MRSPPIDLEEVRKNIGRVVADAFHLRDHCHPHSEVVDDIMVVARVEELLAEVLHRTIHLARAREMGRISGVLEATEIVVTAVTAVYGAEAAAPLRALIEERAR